MKEIKLNLLNDAHDRILKSFGKKNYDLFMIAGSAFRNALSLENEEEIEMSVSFDGLFGRE